MSEREVGWLVDKHGSWTAAEGRIEEKLKPDIYEMNYVAFPFGGGVTSLKPMNPALDNIFDHPGSLASYITKCAKTFWTKREAFKSAGLTHKRGFLLTGVPGTGKTVVTLLVGRAVVKEGGAMIFLSPNTSCYPLGPILKTIRRFHPSMPLVVVIEDLDVHCDPRQRNEANVLLPLFDGEQAIDDVLYIATTNFPEKLDPRITKRPSRFDEVLKMDPPLAIARGHYFKTMFPSMGNETLSELLEVSEGLHFAHIKELAISVMLYDRDAAETAARLRSQSITAEDLQGPQRGGEMDGNEALKSLTDTLVNTIEDAVEDSVHRVANQQRGH